MRLIKLKNIFVILPVTVIRAFSNMYLLRYCISPYISFVDVQVYNKLTYAECCMTNLIRQWEYQYVKVYFTCLTIFSRFPQLSVWAVKTESHLLNDFVRKIDLIIRGVTTGGMSGSGPPLFFGTDFVILRKLL